MPSTNDPTKALNELLTALEDRGARDLADDIRAELARGTLRKLELRKGKQEEAQQAYGPEEAYILAVQMVVAALDPAFMIHDARKLLTNITGGQIEREMIWRADYIEGSLVDRGILQSIEQMAPLPHEAVTTLYGAAIQVVREISSFLKGSS